MNDRHNLKITAIKQTEDTFYKFLVSQKSRSIFAF